MDPSRCASLATPSRFKFFPFQTVFSKKYCKKIGSRPWEILDPPQKRMAYFERKLLENINNTYSSSELTNDLDSSTNLDGYQAFTAYPASHRCKNKYFSLLRLTMLLYFRYACDLNSSVRGRVSSSR